MASVSRREQQEQRREPDRGQLWSRQRQRYQKQREVVQPDDRSCQQAGGDAQREGWTVAPAPSERDAHGAGDSGYSHAEGVSQRTVDPVTQRQSQHAVAPPFLD